MAFKLIRQNDTMQCGATCLRMICLHFKRGISNQGISHYCHTSKSGISIGGLMQAAINLGFDASCNLVEVNDFDSSDLPCIIHWKAEHFVVLYKISAGRFFIADPGRGKFTVGLKEFCECWGKTANHRAGIALFLHPNDKFENALSDTQASTSEHEVFKIIGKLFIKYKKYFILIVIGLILSCLIQLLLPFFSQAIVDIGISNKDISVICLILAGELALVIGSVAIEFTRKWLLLHISMRINISLLRDFFLKIFKLPMSFFENRLLGDILQRMADHSRVEEFLTIKLLSASFSIFSFIVFSAVLCIYDKYVFLVYFAGSILYGMWASCFLKRRRAIDYELFNNQAFNKDVTYSLVSNMQEIKLQDCETRRRTEWEQCQVNLFETQMKSLRLTQWQESGSVLINQSKNILTTILAATAVINGHMTLGMMLSVQFIVGQLTNPIDQIISFINSVQDVKISMERIGEVHCQNNEEIANHKSVTKESLSEGITFDHVTFKYDMHSNVCALKDVSFHIPYKKTTAIVGASGSGKSTIIKLLLGFYDVDVGNVLIGDTNINELHKKAWRNLCGVVMQNGVIFSESIARNIAVGDGDIDYPRLNDSANLAQLAEFVDKLPLGYDTVVGSGGIDLSQGQKQRILIARAIYKNPDFIILDEATNSLDAINEFRISEALSGLYKDKTVIIVAHRLSTVRDADQIIVLSDGQIAEIGNHSSLLQNRGVYHTLVMNQLNLGD